MPPLGIRGSVSYASQGATGVGAPQYDGIQSDFLDNLARLVGDTEFTKQYGWAFNAINYPGPLAGASIQGGLQTLGTGFVTAVYNGAGPLSDVRFSTGNTDNQLASVRTVLTPFKVTAGKRFWASVRLSAAAIATGELVLGLVAEAYAASVAANSFAVASLPVDGIFLIKDDTGTQFASHVRKASASTTTASIDGSALANDVKREYGIFMDVKGNIFFFVDGVLKVTVDSANANVPTVNLAFLVGRQTSGAVFTTLDISQILCAQEL